ncbi:MAG: hypothetical protein WAW00_02200 [Candidatus Moraniibacteriota bacterium]
MQFTMRRIFGIFLVLIVGLLALGAWQTFFAAVVTPGASDIWQPVSWFSLLTVFFFLGTVVWSDVSLRIAGAVLVFLPGLFFVHAWEYVAASVISAALVFWGGMDIAAETDERVRFHFFKSVRAGRFLFVAGLSLALAGGYYVFLKNASWEELVPRFQVGDQVTGVIFKVAGTINPSFAALAEGDATVDEFLLSLEQNKEGMSLFLSADQEKVAQELFLRSGREQIASLVGRQVNGDEKISDTLSFALQRKLITLLQGGDTTQHFPSQAIPFFLALLLFFTFLSLLSLVGIVCVVAAQLLFRLALLIGWLRLERITVAQQKLAE